MAPERPDRLLIVAAARQELAGWGPGRGRHPADDGFEILLTGMGPRAARRAVARKLAGGRFSWVVSVGFAGGTRDGLRTGDLVAPEWVVDARTGERFRAEPFRPGLRGIAAGGTLVSTARVLATEREKREAGERFGAAAVDLETAAVAQEAARAGVPWSSLRVILDPVEAPLAARSLREGAVLLLRPARWRELGSLMRSVQAARETLVRTLSLWVKNRKESQKERESHGSGSASTSD